MRQNNNRKNISYILFNEIHKMLQPLKLPTLRYDHTFELIVYKS